VRRLRGAAANNQRVVRGAVYAWRVHSCDRASFRPPSRHVSPLRSHGTRSFGSLSLATRGASYCVRTPSAGRLDVQEGLLRNMQSCLRDVEGTLYVLMGALLDMQVTDGLAGYDKRKVGPLLAAALRSQQDRQKPQTLLLQRDSAATAPRPRRDRAAHTRAQCV
jgi:hypothetical protein